jgi:hypothetical protein
MRETPFGRFYPNEGTGWKIFAIVLGLLMLPVIGFIGYVDTEWNAGNAAWAAGFAWLAFMMIVFNVLRLRRYRASRMKPGVVVTPIIVGMVGLDSEDAWFFYLKDLVDSSTTHHYRNGSYQYTAFVMKFSTGSLNFTIGRKKDAEALLDYLRSSSATIKSWIAQGTAEREIVRLDWIDACRTAAGPAPKRTLGDSGWAKLGVSAGAALVFGGAVWAMNSVACDIRAFESARQANAAGPLREYLKNSTWGLYAGEARAALREIYRKAEEGYLAKATKAEAQAAEGMKALLAYLRDKETPLVRIAFTGGAPLDAVSILEQAQRQTRSKKISSPAESFTAQRNQQREVRIIDVMKASFSKVFSNDLFDLQSGTLRDDEPRFLVRYRVVASGELFGWIQEEKLPEDQREIFPGIKFPVPRTRPIRIRPEATVSPWLPILRRISE